MSVEKSANCKSDYIIIDKRGNDFYPRKSSAILCGRDKKFGLSSAGNKLNMVFAANSLKRKSTFKLKYKIL